MPSVNIENGKRIEDLLEISTFSTSAHFLVSEHNLTRKTNLTSLRAMFNGDTATTDLNNVYYSVEKLNELFDNVGDEFAKLTERLDTLNLKIQDIYNNLGADIDEFKKKVELMYAELTQADEDIMAYIKEQIRLEQEARNNADIALGNRIDSTNESLVLETKTRETNDNALSDRIDNLSSSLNSNYNTLLQKIQEEANTRSTSDTNLSNRITNNANNISNLSTRVTNNANNISSLSNRVSALENKFVISSSAPGSSLSTGTIWLQYF